MMASTLNGVYPVEKDSLHQTGAHPRKVCELWSALPAWWEDMEPDFLCEVPADAKLTNSTVWGNKRTKQRLERRTST